MAQDGGPAWIIVAGPNGAGKTTVAHTGPGGILSTFLQNQAPYRLNADERARTLEAAGAPHSPATSLLAAQQIDEELETALRTGRSVVVETVLSSNKYRRLIRLSRARGFSVLLVYVCLRSPGLSRRRVALRVKAGGHDVPADRLAPRWLASLDNLAWFGARADAVYVFDNSEVDGGPRLLYARTPTLRQAPGLDDDTLPHPIARALRALDKAM